MRKEQIETLIDRKIETAFSTGSTIINVVKELKERSKNIIKVLDKDGISIEDAQKLEWENIEKARVKYAVHYVNHANKRISDMKWISSKHGVLSINYYTIWKYFKFREFLLNSKPNISEYFDKQRKSAVLLTENTINSLVDKNWSSGKPKKPGQTVLRAFLITRKEKMTISNMISLPEEEIGLYELDLESYNNKTKEERLETMYPNIKLIV